MAEARKLVRRYDVYSLFRCLPRIRGAGYDEEFRDAGEGQSSLSRGVFEWLVSIWPSHLLYRSGDTCYLEPYVPSRFARQFGYDQLYVGNPNLDLAFMGSLIDGARAWRFFTAGGTGACLRTPLKDPNLCFFTADDPVLLPMVCGFQLHTSWIQRQPFGCEVNISSTEAKGF